MGIKWYDRRILSIFMGFIAVMLRIGMPPWMVEQYYSRGIFVYIRWVADSVLGWVPIPLVYFLALSLVFLAAKMLFKLFKKREETTISVLLVNGFLGLGAFIGKVVFWFLLLWGFNYGRQPIEQQWGLTVKPLQGEEILADAQVTDSLVRLARNELSQDSAAMTAKEMPLYLEQTMRERLTEVLDSMRFPTPGSVRIHKLPKGMLQRLGIMGIYIPFVCQGHLDGGLHPLDMPFTYAHEMAHGYGVTDEGDCNFLAYLACHYAREPFIRYSGELNYWRYIFSELRNVNPPVFKEMRNALPSAVKNDLKAIYANRDKYPEIFPKLSEAVNNTYLQTQGVREGILSYDRVVLMVYAWRLKYEPKRVPFIYFQF